MYVLNLGADRRVLSATRQIFAPAGGERVAYLPEGNLCSYRFENSEYRYDPLPDPEPPQAVSLWDELDDAWRRGYESGYREGVDTAYDQ